MVPWIPGSPARLLWAKRPSDAPVLGGFHVFPGGLLEEADSSAPHTGGESVELRVAGLRELFEETGLLHVEGELPGGDERASLRERFLDSPAEGHAWMARRSLRWRTHELVPTGRWVTPAFAPKRFDVHLFGLRLERAHPPDPDLFELEEAEWIEVTGALARWSEGGCLVGPPLAALLRSFVRHHELRPEVVRSAYGAGGEPSQRWEAVPWIWALPFRTPTLPPATMTNSYIVGSGEAVVVEPATPYAEEQARFVEWVEEARRAGLEPRALIATHHHADHVGGARELSERLGLPIWAHAATAERLRGRVEVSRTLADEEVIALDGPVPIRLRAIHTPGHAPGHLCLFEERSRALIAGDMVASVGTIIVEPTDGDMAVYLDSLRRMAALDPSMLLPAHGMPVLDPQRLIAHYIDHRLAREAKVLDALVAHGGPASPMDLVPRAYDDAPKSVWPLAAMSTEAHLIKLVDDGAAARDGARYRPL